MITQREKIIKKAKEILENSPNGIRYMELVNRIHDTCPGMKIKPIQWIVWSLPKEFKKIVKPERGILILEKYIKENIKNKLKSVEKIIKTINEEIFYPLFADYLVNDLEECTKAIPLGGNKFKDKWGTPDVFGVYKFPETDPFRPPIEIVSAEIKTDSLQLITAFGQACSYKLFSHKVYLVIPQDSSLEDISRIESLCSRFGIGLILFDKNNIENPNFTIRTRAIKTEPDYFYVNKYLKLLGSESKKLF